MQRKSCKTLLTTRNFQKKCERALAKCQICDRKLPGVLEILAPILKGKIDKNSNYSGDLHLHNKVEPKFS